MIEIWKRAKARATGPAAPRILVVEDDVELSRLVRRAASMAASDIGVDVVHTSAEAKTALRRSSYDFVLLDNFLDADNRGIDLVEVVRKTQPRARVALMSAMDAAELAKLTEKDRSVQILPKPFSAGALRLLLHEALGLRGICPANTARLA